MGEVWKKFEISHKVNKKLVMSDTSTATPAVEQPKIVDPFDDSNWRETVISDATKEPAKAEPAATPAATTTEPAEETFDEAAYLKTKFGWESHDDGIKELEELRKLKANPPAKEPEFANEDSKKVFDYIKSGNIKKLREFLDRQDRLERVTKYELSKADEAAEVLKTHMRFKHPDLTEDDIDYHINKKFRLPEKPVNNLDLTDEENVAAMERWQSQVSDIQRDMIIEAKLARPELTKFQSELSLPDLEYKDPQAEERRQKEEAAWQANRETYVKTLESDFKNFKSYDITAKTEEGEYPLQWVVSEKEQMAQKEELSNFNKDEYFDKRWFDESGKPYVQQIMADKYWLENRDKIVQKLVNDTAQKVLADVIKKHGNVNVNGPAQQRTPVLDNANKDQVVSHLWDNA